MSSIAIFWQLRRDMLTIKINDILYSSYKVPTTKFKVSPANNDIQADISIQRIHWIPLCCKLPYPRRGSQILYTERQFPTKSSYVLWYVNFVSFETIPLQRLLLFPCFCYFVCLFLWVFYGGEGGWGGG